ncbi:MAG: hypothetical protein Q8P10_02290 [bacterium]|nr:hypothetical protein [bacterium]
MLEIIPAILEQDWVEIEKKIELAKSFVKTIHIDVADGIMVPNTTFLDSAPFAKYTKSLPDILFEAHFMVSDPIKYLKPFADAGFKRFIGHVEKMPDQEEFVAQGQLLGEVGLGFDGPTNLDMLKVPLDDLDCVFFYTSDKAGFSGPPFNPQRLGKVRKIRSRNSQIPIEVDGGLNEETIVFAKNAGVTRFAVTSALFRRPDPPHIQFQKLNELLK